METSFAAFILTHRRPKAVFTHHALRHYGYTGPIYLILDDEDPTADEYREAYGEEWVKTFSKAEVAKTFDAADQSMDRGTIVYARNASWVLARDLGLSHFIQLDDDYTYFSYRIQRQGPRGGRVSQPAIRDLDAIFRLMVQLLEDTGALTVAMSQGGDNIGGGRSTMITEGYKRKAMNSFVVRTDRPIPFAGRLNEDVNAYCLEGSRGQLFLTVGQLQLQQKETQRQAGGMTEAYLDAGTYVKSFYTVMMCPSFVKIRELKQRDPRMDKQNSRLHHSIRWENAVPKILDPGLKRAA